MKELRPPAASPVCWRCHAKSKPELVVFVRAKLWDEARRLGGLALAHRGTYASLTDIECELVTGQCVCEGDVVPKRKKKKKKGT